jgi:hypothetical protein
VWKIFGARLDGWTNADHPTESVPGNPATLPSGAEINEADLDFTGTIMPPAGSGVPPLTIDEKMLIARWIDLGAPIDETQGSYGWFLDDLRPTLEVSAPRPGWNPTMLASIRIGVADAHSGIDVSSLSVTADVAIAGRQPGAELADLAQPAGDGIYTISVSPPLANVAATLHVAIADDQGNVTRVTRRFSVSDQPPAPTPLPTPTGGLHDARVDPPRRPVKLRLRVGAASRAKTLRVGVRNADLSTGRGDPGQEIQLVVGEGTCPPGTLAGLPDFFTRVPGAQDRIVVRPGKRKRAHVPIVVAADAFTMPGNGEGAVCHLQVQAVGQGVERTPADNVGTVELRVFDDNDG